jgi:hypothetical protein
MSAQCINPFQHSDYYLCHVLYHQEIHIVLTESICWLHKILRINVIFLIKDTDQLDVVVETLHVLPEIRT